MVCRQCGTEIAAKAIICYKCGAATATPAPARGVSPGRGAGAKASAYNTWLIAAVIAILAGVIWWWMRYR